MRGLTYTEGYKTGRNWKDDYIPGGPFVCDKESREDNLVWMEGFYDGLKNNRYKNNDKIIKLMKSNQGRLGN